MGDRPSSHEFVKKQAEKWFKNKNWQPYSFKTYACSKLSSKWRLGIPYDMCAPGTIE
jgi:hypothetical protein